jgi:hypothetical protein
LVHTIGIKRQKAIQERTAFYLILVENPNDAIQHGRFNGSGSAPTIQRQLFGVDC